MTLEYISLSELTENIEKGLKKALPREYWITAEISELTITSKGHCYLELIEKPKDSNTITAKIKATIWANNFTLIQAYFTNTTGIDLQPGLQILVKTSVEFHSVYGISLQITDIDPVYTIGEEEKQKREILIRLEQEGIITMNKDIPFPTIPQRIAVISSTQAAGYQDFINQLHNNPYSISYSTTLFPASMQGIETEQSIIKALDSIYEQESDFDIVVIIRGGGSKTDLRWFDNYNIAAHIAQFPLPVITGIGHDKDESIADIVAYESLKTPTAVADYILEFAIEMLATLENLQDTVITLFEKKLQESSMWIQTTSQKIMDVYKQYMTLSNSELENKKKDIFRSVQFIINQKNTDILIQQQKLQSRTSIVYNNYRNTLQNTEQTLKNTIILELQKLRQRTDILETKVSLHNPERILSQGYSITTNAKGEIIKDSNHVTKGDTIHTKLYKGTITSTI